jgi:hypothetical protein
MCCPHPMIALKVNNQVGECVPFDIAGVGGRTVSHKDMPTRLHESKSIGVFRPLL